MRFTLLALLLSLADCAGGCAAPRRPTTDAGIDSLRAELVCYHLVTIHCDMGDACVEVLAQNQGITTDFHIQCLLDANSTFQAEACGSVKCR